jgi:hypothetical protein
MTILEKVEAHNQEVLSSQVPKDLITCPHCHQRPPIFKLHDVRTRKFLVVIEELVHLLQGLLARWKCTVCGNCFTWYPDFALPYKRYVKDSIVKLSRKYVEDDNTTYNDVVQHQSSLIAYNTDKGIEERCLAGSTVHRWLSWMGETLKAPLSRALELIRQKDPSCNIFRVVRPVAAQKYRGHRRRSILDSAIRFLTAEGVYNSLFGQSIFPRLATGFSSG